MSLWVLWLEAFWLGLCGRKGDNVHWSKESLMSGSQAGTLNLTVGQSKNVNLDYVVQPGGVTPPPAATVTIDQSAFASITRGTITLNAGSTQDFTETLVITGDEVGTTTVHALNSAGVDQSDFTLIVAEPPADSVAWDPTTLT